MGFDAPTRVAIRERRAPPGRRGIECPKCHGMNPPAILRCTSCRTPLPSKAAAAPRTVSPIPRTEFDAILGDLEATLTRGDAAPDVRYQCPACGRFVDASASRCRCGVLFEDPRPIVGYECPVCGARVSATAVRCACGARFA